jgi:hypothetical protein
VSRSLARWMLVVASVLLWFLAVLPAYYVVHKPLTGGEALAPINLNPALLNIVSAVLSRLADLVLLALTLIVAAAWGNRIQRWIGAPSDSHLEQWAMGATLGLGLLGSLVFLLGAFPGLYRWVGYTILLGLGLAARSEIQALFRWLVSARHMRPKGIPWLWLYAGFIGLFSLGMALLPPTGWDALVYHLQGPRLYLEAHRLVAVPENLYLNWPAQVEMLFTWGMLLKGDILAKLFHWAFWPLTALMLYALGRRTVGVRAGRWAVALWASIPFAVDLAGLAYVDLGLTAFVLAAISSFLHWTDSGSDRWLLISTLFAGLAMATKYTAAIWLGLLVLLFAYHGWRHHRRSWRWIVGRAAAFALVAGLPLLPWLIKNSIVTGNPLYPFLCGGTAWNSTRQAWLAGSGGGYSRNPVDYVALPWLATVVGTTGTAAFDATTGPLLLCLVPLAFLVRGRPRAVNYGLALAGGQLVYFAATIYQYVYLVETRLLLPIFPLLCLAAAFALEQLSGWDRKVFRLSRVIVGVAAVVLAVNVITEARDFFSIRPLAPLLGLESREEYLARRLGAYQDAMHFVNDRLPAGSRILFLWEPRSYYSQYPALGDATLDNLAQLRLTNGDEDMALAALRSRGFTHLLLYRSGLVFLLEPTPRPPTVKGLLKPSLQEESYYPLKQDDLNFLENLLGRCQRVGSLREVYEIYQLP